MTEPFGSSVPVLAEREERPLVAREIVLVVLVLLTGLLFRSLNIDDAWSGREGDFHSAFGGGSTGGPARNFFNFGFKETWGVPIEWRVELEDGSRLYSFYPHHPTTCISITALSMMVFGPSEWASRLPWILASMLALFGTWRVARLVWNPSVALLALLFTAVMPFAVYFASMQWIDGLVVFTYTLVICRYVRWLRSGARRDLVFAALYAFLGGLCEWSAIFILPGLGLHALLLFGLRGHWRALLSTLWLPIGLLAGFGVHALHLRLTLSPEELAVDTSSTLAWVTSLPIPLAEFIPLQWAFLQRYLTPPVTALVVAGAVWMLVRGLATRGNRLSREEGVLLPLALAGVLYVSAFPARSYNHNFFVGLSVPFFGIASALICWRLFQTVRRAERVSPAIFGTLLLSTFGVLAAVLASERSAEIQLSWSEPTSWLFVPLLLARWVPYLALAGALVSFALNARRWQATLALICALSGTVSFAAWGDVRFWATNRSDRVGQLVEEPWLSEVLEDPRAVIVTTGNVSMPLQFYSAGPVFISTYAREHLLELKQKVLSKLGPGRRVVFLYETVALTRDAQAGRLKPKLVEAVVDLRSFLGTIAEPVVRGEFEVFEIAEWATSGESDHAPLPE